MIKQITIDERFCPKNHPCPVVNMCPTGAITQKDFHSAPEIVRTTASNAVFVQADAMFSSVQAAKPGNIVPVKAGCFLQPAFLFVVTLRSQYFHTALS